MSNGLYILTNAIVLLFLFYLIYYYLKKDKIRKNGFLTDGRIINFEDDNDGSRIPIIGFKPLSGNYIEKRYNTSVRSRYKIGDSVGVIYDPSRPTDFIIDSSWERRKFISLIVMNILLLIATLFFF